MRNCGKEFYLDMLLSFQKYAPITLIINAQMPKSFFIPCVRMGGHADVLCVFVRNRLYEHTPVNYVTKFKPLLT